MQLRHSTWSRQRFRNRGLKKEGLFGLNAEQPLFYLLFCVDFSDLQKFFVPLFDFLACVDVYCGICGAKVTEITKK